MTTKLAKLEKLIKKEIQEKKNAKVREQLSLLAGDFYVNQQG